MPGIGTFIEKLKSPFITEREEFINHIKVWIPISIFIGLVVGSVMSLFLIFIFFINSLLGFENQLISMAIGSAIIIYMIKIGWESLNKNGMNYVIKTKHNHEIVPIEETKEFITSGIALGSGLPIGKEGPALVIGSAIACKIANIFRIKQEDLHNAITIGSAAATGALFQAPLGSAIFASEVPYKQDSDEPMLMVSFLASVIAAVTMKTISDFINMNLFIFDIHLFKLGDAFLEINFRSTILAFLLGIVIGYMGQFFIEFYYFYKKEVVSKFKPLNSVILSIILMLFILGIGRIIVPDLYIVEGLSSFNGIEQFIQDASIKIIWIILIAILIQVLATSVIISSGFPGGIFGPSLSIGALMGIIFAIILQETDTRVITSYAIIGMSASHAATTKTPIASVLLIMEITGLPHLVIPIVIANIASYVTSGYRSLYENQIHSRDAQILRQLSQYDQMEEFKVVDIMTQFNYLEFVTPDTTLIDMKNMTLHTNKHTFPVIEGKKVVGIISYGDLRRALDEGSKTTVAEAMIKEVVVMKENMTGRQAMQQLISSEVERCPVIDENGVIKGIITIKDILRGHQKIRELNKQYFD